MTNQKDLTKSWSITRNYLNKAMSLLPDTSLLNEGKTISSVKEFLENNELELALDGLVILGKTNSMSNDYWNNLIQAVKNMELFDRIPDLEKLLKKK